jgi:hypothetical protein
MNLAAGNPNLKKAAMRVNPKNSLEAVRNTLGDKEQVKYRTGFVPSVKPPDAVPPPQMNLWARDTYAPPKNEYVRPGANDFLNVKSRGF